MSGAFQRPAADCPGMLLMRCAGSHEALDHEPAVQEKC